MKFIDYYSILGVSFEASSNEIKSAFRTRSKELHPDLNRQEDTTEKMQLLVEAYEILKNPTSRSLYNVEYLRYNEIYTDTSEEGITSEYVYENVDFEEIVTEARKSAKEYIDEFLLEFKQSSSNALGAMGNEFVNLLTGSFYLAIILGLILLSSEAC